MTTRHEQVERAHQELCTGLTIVRSRVALARRAGRFDAERAAPWLREHFDEIDAAVDRLQLLAHELRHWDDEDE